MNPNLPKLIAKVLRSFDETMIPTITRDGEPAFVIKAKNENLNLIAARGVSILITTEMHLIGSGAVARIQIDFSSSLADDVVILDCFLNPANESDQEVLIAFTRAEHVYLAFYRQDLSFVGQKMCGWAEISRVHMTEKIRIANEHNAKIDGNFNYAEALRIVKKNNPL